MRKILFVVLAALMLSGCVVEPVGSGYSPYYGYGGGYHHQWGGYHHGWR